MGGVVPGGFAGTKKDVFENGLVIAPQLLYARDKPVKSAWSPDLRQRPLRRRCCCPTSRRSARTCASASGCCSETIERYGLDAVHGAMRYACDVVGRDDARGDHRGCPTASTRPRTCSTPTASTTTRAATRSRSRSPSAGDRVEVDLSGTSRQARDVDQRRLAGHQDRGGRGVQDAASTRASPFTSAAYRDIDIVLPEALRRQRATRRTGRSSCTGRARRPLLNAILRALDKPLGERAVGGDFGSLSHPQRARRARRRHAVAVRRPGAAASTARGARPARATPTATRSSTWPTTSTRRPRRSRPTCRRSCCARSTRRTRRAPGYNRGGAAVLKDTMFLRDAAALLDAAAPQEARAAPA